MEVKSESLANDFQRVLQNLEALKAEWENFSPRLQPFCNVRVTNAPQSQEELAPGRSPMSVALSDIARRIENLRLEIGVVSQCFEG